MTKKVSNLYQPVRTQTSDTPSLSPQQQSTIKESSIILFVLAFALGRDKAKRLRTRGDHYNCKTSPSQGHEEEVQGLS